MKKIIVYLLLSSLLLSFLTSCNTKAPEKSNNDTASTTEQIENTVIAPPTNEEKYKPVLDMYKYVVMNLDNQAESKDTPYTEGTQEYKWWTAILGAVASYHLSTNVPGYAFCDLNKNGNDEMLLLLDDYTVLAIFSYADGSPVLLDNYWNRKVCTIEKDGSIQVYGNNGAESSSFSIFEISSDDKKLVLLSEYGTDGYDTETLIPYYYKISNGTKTSITVLEYTAALSQGVAPFIEYLTENTKQNTAFEFVPLGLEISYKRIFEKILSYDAKINSENKYLWQLHFSFEQNSIASFESVEICYLDIDGDGIPELLLRGGMGDHLILRYYNGTVYLYEYSYKEMGRVYEDGSFSWHSKTYLEDNSINYGVSRLTFDGSELREQSLYVIFEGENESYFTVNGKLTSKSELYAYIENRKDIKEVTWTSYQLDSDKIPSLG